MCFIPVCFSKYCPAVWPSNIQFQNHFAEFLYYGYKPSIGVIDVRFPHRDGSRSLADGSVGITDGLTKILLMAAIVGFIEELELSETDIKNHATLTATLQSFACIKCTYQEYSNPSHHFLQALRHFASHRVEVFTIYFKLFLSCPTVGLGVVLEPPSPFFPRFGHQETGYTSAEKIEPSPLTVMAEIGSAIELERKMARGGRTGLRDLLIRVVSEYNRIVTKKSHRIDSGRKAMIFNLFPGNIFKIYLKQIIIYNKNNNK